MIPHNCASCEEKAAKKGMGNGSVILRDEGEKRMTWSEKERTQSA